MILPSDRVRTVLATTSHLELGVLGLREVIPAHAIDPYGGIVLRPGEGPCWQRLRHGEPSPLLDLVATDVTSVPQPDRIRARVRMRGLMELVPAPPHRRLQRHLNLLPGQPMARFLPQDVMLDLSSASVRRVQEVPLSAYTEAVTDPLAGWESRWIAHLDSQHAAALRELANQALPLTGNDTVRALQGDAGGVTVRVYQADSQRDLRFEFAARVCCGCQAVAAFTDLVTPSPGGKYRAGKHSRNAEGHS